jgi:pimeloyl-ACP methyl ester carboxylesterase
MDLFYREFGKGQPLIILHGLFGMSDNWMTLAKRFSSTHKVFLLDQRNHGQSPHHPEFNYKVMSEDLHKFIIDNQLKNVILLGHSMGGKVAMNFALQHEEYIEKIIIVDITTKAYNIKRFISILKTLQALPIEKISDRKEADLLLAQTIKTAALRQFLLKNLKRDNEGTFKWKLNITALLNNLNNISQEINSDKNCSKPLLLIKGGKSDYVKDEDLTQLKRLFPAAKWMEIANTTHWVHTEAADEFYRVVMNFISEEPQ